MFYFSGFLQTFTSLIEKVFINFRVILFYFYKNIISIGRYKYFTLLFNPTLDSQNNSQLPCTVCVALCCEMRQNVITITLPTYHIKIETINYFYISGSFLVIEHSLFFSYTISPLLPCPPPYLILSCFYYSA